MMTDKLREAAQLLPCPFCGNAATLCGSDNERLITGWFVLCESCGASQRIQDKGDSGESAVAAWNNRAAMEQQDATETQRSSCDVKLTLEVDAKAAIAAIADIRKQLADDDLEDPAAADCCPHCEALIHHAQKDAYFKPITRAFKSDIDRLKTYNSVDAYTLPVGATGDVTLYIKE